MILKFLMLVGLSLSTTAFASGLIPDEETCKSSDKKSAECLSMLLNYRCVQLSLLVGPLADCQQAAASFVKSFDMTLYEAKAYDGKTYKLPVIFKTKLLALIKDTKAQEFLSQLDLKLGEASRERTPFNLYYNTYLLSGSHSKAAEYLAVFFQDTSWTQWQVKYLEDHTARLGTVPTRVSIAIRNLKSLATFLEGDNLSKNQYRTWFTLYPIVRDTKLNDVLNLNSYHFYPMTYLTHLLVKSGASKHMAFYLPFLFNTDYELREVDASRWPMQFPEPFELLPKYNWMMQDIYAGYTGALFGINGLSNARSFQQLSADIASAPTGTLRSLFWGL